MGAFPIIFPSLTRQPSMDSSQSLEDDTIRDPAESGYVATRPRFTRGRRTWKQNIRNLAAEDIRALDQFAMVTAARGGNSFLYPNLLPNGSFELPPLSAADLVAGWNATPTPAIAVATTGATVLDGAQAIGFATISASHLAAHSSATATLACDIPIPCNPGEVYCFTASASTVAGTAISGMTRTDAVSVAYQDINGNTLSTTLGTAAAIGGGWKAYGLQFTVPANAVTFTVALVMTLANSTGSAIAFDGTQTTVWDCAACALVTPLSAYGRMAGSLALGVPVRFGNLPEYSDIGFGNGVKLYGAHFELTEV
jgi:hypothetical protein